MSKLCSVIAGSFIVVALYLIMDHSIFVLTLCLLASADNSFANSLNPNQDRPGSKPIETDRIPEIIF